MLGAMSDIDMEGVVVGSAAPELVDSRAQYRASNQCSCSLVMVFNVLEGNDGEW